MSTKNKNHHRKPTRTTELDFKTLQHELRELDLQWVSNLVKQIQVNKEIEKKFRDEVDERKIYNAFNNVLRSGGWKLMIYRQAKSMRDRLTKEWEETQKA